MTAPDCTDHGSLILDYIRGKLSEADGLRAEALLEDCTICQSWMDREFSGTAFAKIEGAVDQGLDALVLPHRRHRFGWIAAAAAIVIVAGGLTIMQLPNQSIPMTTDQQRRDHSIRIGSFDFEAGSIGNAPPTLEETSVVVDAIETDPLFSDNLEDGGTGSWTIHT